MRIFTRGSKLIYVLSTLIFVVVLLNLFYSSMIMQSRGHQIVPASSYQIIEQVNAEGNDLIEIRRTIKNYYTDINRYMNNIRSKGNLFHSTTLGVFWRDSQMSDYILAHQSDQPIAVINRLNSDMSTSLTSLIRADIENASTLFSSALSSYSPIKWKKIAEAEMLFYELNAIVNQNVGDRVGGKTLIYNYITKQ